MPRDPATHPQTVIAWAIGMTLAAAALVWALILARHVLLLLYVSALLAIGFSPLIRLIERQKVLPIGTRVPRWAAILVLYLAILGTLVGIGFLVFPPLVIQARALLQQLPRLFEGAQRWLLARGILSEHMTFGEVVQQSPASSDAVGTLLVTFWTVLGGVFGVLTILILTFYFLVDAESFLQGIERLFARQRRARIRAVSRAITDKVSAWLVGQLILAGVIGVTSAVGLVLLGVPYSYVLAVMAAVGELIPYIGPVLSAIPALLVAATVSLKLTIAVAILFFVQQQMENYLLVPKIMEQRVGLSPVVVIVALLLGSALMGVVGAILAVPTAAILQVLYQELVPDGEDRV